MVDYNPNMKAILYKTGEIEFYEGELHKKISDFKSIMYFQNITDLLDLISTNSQLEEELRNALLEE